MSYPNPANLYGKWKTRVFYRLVNVAKRIAGSPPLVFPRGESGAFEPECFRALLAAAGLSAEQMEHTSYLVVPSPLDDLLPRMTERLGWRLEGSGPAISRRLAGQVVFAARKPA